jgi:hypothetical protein
MGNCCEETEEEKARKAALRGMHMMHAQTAAKVAEKHAPGLDMTLDQLEQTRREERVRAMSICDYDEAERKRLFTRIVTVLQRHHNRNSKTWSVLAVR